MQGNVEVIEEARVEGTAQDGRGVHGIALFFDLEKAKPPPADPPKLLPSKAKTKATKKQAPPSQQARSRGVYIALDPPNRKLKIAFLQQGKWKVWLPWKEHDAIRKGESNRLHATVQNGQLLVKINKTTLAPISLPQTLSGLACVFVQQGGTDVTFKQFHVQEPQP